jgi:alpha-mannosidase
MTGHQYELRTALGSASSLYDDIADGLSRLTKLLGPFPRHWARRRFGMTHSLPEMLTVFGFESALHVALDDGIYPDREYGQMTWQGPGRGEVPATSRIPLAIDSASTFLRFPDRFTETMQEDNSAVMLLAHLPRLNTPWLQDLRRGARYAPVLGRFVTFDEFITQTSGQGSSFRFNAGEYLSPALIQSSVLKSESPISSPAELHDWRSVLDSVASVSAVAGMLKGDTQTTENGLASLTSTLMQEETRRSDTTGPSSDGDGTDVPAPAEVAKQINDQLKQYSQQSLDVFRGLIPSQDSPGTQGMFIVNPLPHSRRHIVQWPQNLRLPKLPTKSDTVYQQDNQTFIETRLPAGGFLWLTEADATAASPVQSGKGQSLAEPYMLRNQHFEVLINEATGGIAEVRCHGRRGNRVSQQVAFRYESGKTVQDENGDDITFNYAATRMVSSRVLSSGPWQAAIETRNEIVDVTSGEVLAGFRQTISVERTAPQIDIHIEFGNPVSDVRGNPWMTYFCSRFAWDNEAASITRGLLGQACGFRAERFESPDYIEVADSDQRLLIIPHGRPYHRRSGSRMLDSLLIVEGETSRSFRFTIEIDQPFPMRTVQELRHPVLAQATTAVRPAGAATGWILGVTAKNVMLSRLRSELQNAADVSDDQTSSETEHLTSPSGRKMVILLVETEGRSTDCTIRTARKPSSAYVRTACGEISHQLEVLPEGVPIAMAGFQMQEVVLEFGTRTGSQADRAAESDRESKKN